MEHCAGVNMQSIFYHAWWLLKTFCHTFSNQVGVINYIKLKARYTTFYLLRYYDLLTFQNKYPIKFNTKTQESMSHEFELNL